MIYQLNYEQATDFDRAWLNFELDLPLKPGADGERNPFYVQKSGNPLDELKDALLAPFYAPPKFFFSGHRGCGKSTELLHLLGDKEIQKKYWAINFSIRQEADIIDLDFKDVLLAIGGKLFRQYRQSGGQLDEQLLNEISAWKGKVEQEVATLKDGRISGFEVGAGLDAFFANAGIRMKLEPASRVEIRQTFERDITGLISVINAITAAIYKQEGRFPLVLIDDMDKPDLEKAREIFHDRLEIMLQPQCAIVYTVSSALFYSKEFDAIRDRAIFLPNVNLYHPGSNEINQEGYQTMKKFIDLRISPDLITDKARDLAIHYSGGVFREMARVMRTSIGHARRRGASQVDETDVEWSAIEIRNEYRRILDKSDLQLLKTIDRTKKLEYVDRLRPLLQLLAILEYRDGENWCDVHPALRKLFDD